MARAATVGDDLVDGAAIGRSRSRGATRRFAWGHGAAIRTGRDLGAGGALGHPLHRTQAVSILHRAASITRRTGGLTVVFDRDQSVGTLRCSPFPVSVKFSVTGLLQVS